MDNSIGRQNESIRTVEKPLFYIHKPVAVLKACAAALSGAVPIRLAASSRPKQRSTFPRVLLGGVPQLIRSAEAAPCANGKSVDSFIQQRKGLR